MINVKTATTAELLAYFNANSGQKPVARFSDRKSAERRVTQLLLGTPEAKFSKELAGGVKKPAAKKAAYKQLFVDGSAVCPACGKHEDITCGRIVESKKLQRVVDEHIATCHHCDHTWNMDTGRAVKSAAASPERSAAIAASWKNKGVAAARATRHGVVVVWAGRSEKYSSVREAFVRLGLPLGRHIKFRGVLKASGRAEFNGHKFSLA
jgi:transposase-like protein